MDSKPKILSLLDFLTAVFFVAAVFMVFSYAPLERTMGLVQKVFYFHVATAWVGMLGFLVAAVVGVLYLIRGERKYDVAGLAAVEISLVFFFIAIVSGSIWARPVWNTWWTWDPRLTTATVVELIYAAYLMLRQGIEDPDRRARFGAVYAVLGFISVPLTFISIRCCARFTRWSSVAATPMPRAVSACPARCGRHFSSVCSLFRCSSLTFCGTASA